MKNISSLLKTALSLRIIKALILEPEKEFLYNDLVQFLGSNPTRTYIIARQFSEAGIIKDSKKVKHFQFHKFNQDHPQAQLLMELFKLKKNG